MILGLTGSIGMGKSTVAAMFANEGVPVFDADATVHALQGPGGQLVAAIERAFPHSTVDGAVDRRRLGTMVFGDDAAIAQLEHIVHPAVALERAAFLERHGESLVLFDIPLLFETGGESNVDKIIVVSAPAEAQRTRVLARPGMTLEKFHAILARQTPDVEKRARADFVIATETSFEQTLAQVRAVIACVRPREGG
jgi:dephospho-CoA kinase